MFLPFRFILLATVLTLSTMAHDIVPHARLVQPAAIEGARRPVDERTSQDVIIRILNEEGNEAAGLIRFRDATGNWIDCPTLLRRSSGLSEKSFGAAVFSHMDSWYVLDGNETVRLPREIVHIEAFAGLESRLSILEHDLSEGTTAQIDVPLTFFYDRRARGNVAGNVHLHLQKMTSAEAESYATSVARADQLDVVYLSYLERAEADAHYISNTFTQADLARFTKNSGVLFGYGEEYRHNLIRHEGYGHVMFLDLWQPILPASLGPDITHHGNDDTPLRPGIEKAHAAGATVLWCHNVRGTEDIPSWLAGLLQGQIFFEQDSDYPGHDGIYSYLNIGLKVPVSTGTDWFYRDMAMTYVQSTYPVESSRWLADLRHGKSYMTNGPLLTFTVNGKELGETLTLADTETITIRGSATGRRDFGTVEVVENGEVIHRVTSHEKTGYYEAAFELQREVDSSVWFALRVAPMGVDYNRPDQKPASFNEYGKPLFAHTSPVYITVDGQTVFVPEAAQRLKAQVTRDKAMLESRGNYSSVEARGRVLRRYDEAIATLDKLITSKGNR